MTTQLLRLAAPARPNAEDIAVYAERARRKAEALLRAAAFDLRRRSIGVRATVDADGAFAGLVVTRSCGCRHVDRIAELALCRMYLSEPPAGIAGHVLDLELGAPRAAAA